MTLTAGLARRMHAALAVSRATVFAGRCGEETHQP
jgi:hypothetical protein